MRIEKQVEANVCQIGWGILRNGLIVIEIIFIPSLLMFFIWQTVSTILFTDYLRYGWNLIDNNIISLKELKKHNIMIYNIEVISLIYYDRKF
ncbi:hypothetical protein BWK59_01230 [Flavobacterium davisii]|uniref:Uncharacterized protein n=1 Tax=Flavobacterium davisii TaxID=2906077 RepID=A0A2D0AIX0_9FLAO|nr:hypothetical protein BWK59_01230 [Flavobacterium davisii]